MAIKVSVYGDLVDIILLMPDEKYWVNRGARVLAGRITPVHSHRHYLS